MIKKNSESVLCIKRVDLPKDWVGSRSAFKMDEHNFFSTCEAVGFCWVDRNEAESDSSLKQVIPYIVLKSKDMIGVYKRKGSEKRLHDLYSIGIGGHINPDDSVSYDSFRQILNAGMIRELDEELLERPSDATPEFQGIINEELTDVGKVHLGALFVIETLFPEAFIPGEELVEFHWMKKEKVPLLNLELWSVMALEIL
ncbi:conserved hypothetical protein [Desulfamplus magnetovallimortis]|uniref:Nudix hydrolase domain-containing protein n=1 Tax=Desulfamplus magnetovallimortis TaxID=1246637 RepID=A0A1W1HF21_9BACT|nr:hypothetical protein [Desulfamplus magnetovallimortis]SLM31026.1 conserved hypothetical protein [Desulfamplus magnetovallimortis]